MSSSIAEMCMKELMMQQKLGQEYHYHQQQMQQQCRQQPPQNTIGGAVLSPPSSSASTSAANFAFHPSSFDVARKQQQQQQFFPLFDRKSTFVQHCPPPTMFDPLAAAVAANFIQHFATAAQPSPSPIQLQQPFASMAAQNASSGGGKMFGGGICLPTGMMPPQFHASPFGLGFPPFPDFTHSPSCGSLMSAGSCASLDSFPSSGLPSSPDSTSNSSLPFNNNGGPPFPLVRSGFGHHQSARQQTKSRLADATSHAYKTAAAAWFGYEREEEMAVEEESARKLTTLSAAPRPAPTDFSELGSWVGSAVETAAQTTAHKSGGRRDSSGGGGGKTASSCPMATTTVQQQRQIYSSNTNLKGNTTRINQTQPTNNSSLNKKRKKSTALIRDGDGEPPSKKPTVAATRKLGTTIFVPLEFPPLATSMRKKSSNIAGSVPTISSPSLSCGGTISPASISAPPLTSIPCRQLLPNSAQMSSSAASSPLLAVTSTTKTTPNGEEERGAAQGGEAIEEKKEQLEEQGKLPLLYPTTMKQAATRGDYDATVSSNIINSSGGGGTGNGAKQMTTKQQQKAQKNHCQKSNKTTRTGANGEKEEGKKKEMKRPVPLKEGRNAVAVSDGTRVAMVMTMEEEEREADIVAGEKPPQIEIDLDRVKYELFQLEEEHAAHQEKMLDDESAFLLPDSPPVLEKENNNNVDEQEEGNSVIMVKPKMTNKKKGKSGKKENEEEKEEAEERKREKGAKTKKKRKGMEGEDGGMMANEEEERKEDCWDTAAQMATAEGMRNGEEEERGVELGEREDRMEPDSTTSEEPSTSPLTTTISSSSSEAECVNGPEEMLAKSEANAQKVEKDEEEEEMHQTRRKEANVGDDGVEDEQQQEEEDAEEDEEGDEHEEAAEKRVPCRWTKCTERFADDDHLYDHMNSAHIEQLKKWVLAEQRELEQQKKSGLKRRRSNATDNAKERFRCRWRKCEQFPRRGDAQKKLDWLLKHLVIRHAPKARPYSCLFTGCALRFPKVQALNDHLRSTHDDNNGKTNGRRSAGEEVKTKVSCFEFRPRVHLPTIRDCIDARTMEWIRSRLNDESFAYGDNDDDNKALGREIERAKLRKTASKESSSSHSMDYGKEKQDAKTESEAHQHTPQQHPRMPTLDTINHLKGLFLHRRKNCSKPFNKPSSAALLSH